MEGDIKIPLLGSAASKTKSPARGTKQGPWIFLCPGPPKFALNQDIIPELPTLAFLQLTCSSRLPRGSSSCSCTSSEGASLLLPQSAASTAHTGHWTRKGAWKLPVRQWECTTEKDVRRGIKKKNIWVMLSLLYPQSNLSQHELVLAAVFSPSHPGIWEPEPQELTLFLRVHSEPPFENCWSSLTSSMWNYKSNT